MPFGQGGQIRKSVRAAPNLAFFRFDVFKIEPCVVVAKTILRDAARLARFGIDTDVRIDESAFLKFLQMLGKLAVPVCAKATSSPEVLILCL